MGITCGVERRLAQHAADKDWWVKVDPTKTEVTWFDTRIAAELAELIVIRDEAPKYAGSAGRRPWTPDTATERQLRLRQVAIEAFKRADEETEKAMLAAGAAHADGVPMEDLAEQTGRSRATLFRRTKSTNAVLWTGDNLDEVQAVRPDARLNANGDLVVDHADGTGPAVVGLNYVVHRRE